VAHGIKFVAPGIEIVAHGIKFVAHGIEIVAHGFHVPQFLWYMALVVHYQHWSCSTNLFNEGLQIP
jgi:hypothetical protein